MSTPDELRRLTAGTLRLWRRSWPEVAGWWSLGWAIQLAAMLASVLLGRFASELALVVFILGPLGLVAGLVLGLHATGTQLDFQPLHFGSRTRQQVLAASLPAVLGVYALWGLTDDSVRQLFALNHALYGLNIDVWSVNLARVWSYLALAAGAWLVRRGLALLPVQGHPVRAWAGALLEGLWVFASFLAIAAAGGQLTSWWRTRAVAVALGQAWQSFLGWLPDWSLWWEVTLPEAVAEGAELIVTTVIPGFLDAVLLPLVWLALAALVLGWDDFTRRPVADSEAARRVAAAAGTQWRRLGPLRRPLAALSTDLREKYLPLLHAVRLVWRTGPAFMAAYLLLMALIRSLGEWAWVGARSLLPDWDETAELMFQFVGGFGHGLVFTTLLLAGYAFGFDRCLGAQRATLSTDSPPNQRNSPDSPPGATVTSATTSAARTDGTVTE